MQLAAVWAVFFGAWVVVVEEEGVPTPTPRLLARLGKVAVVGGLKRRAG
jgi:hypothetical protein